MYVFSATGSSAAAEKGRRGELWTADEDPGAVLADDTPERPLATRQAREVVIVSVAVVGIGIVIGVVERVIFEAISMTTFFLISRSSSRMNTKSQLAPKRKIQLMRFTKRLLAILVSLKQLKYSPPTSIS